MTEEEFFSTLRTLNLQQLEQFQQKIEQKAQEKKCKSDKRKAAMQTPPRKTSDVETMADQMGLDISSLMREISRR